MNTYEVLVEALKSRKAVGFVYNGQPRIVSPYIVGRNKMMGYQSAGGSNSGALGVPKFFEIPLIRDIRIVEDAYVVPPHQPQSKTLAIFDTPIY